MFCVDFRSEIGQQFNQGVVPYDAELVARLKRILADHLAMAV